MEKETIRNIKSSFFSLRNGIIADRLRRSGSPYKIIFGLLIPQIEQIAATYEPSVELAETLWANKSTRESRLMATMVFPKEEFSAETAKKWALEADTIELVDSLCFRLARNLPDAEDLAFCSTKKEELQYFALRLLMNLLIIRKLSDIDAAHRLAESSLSNNNPAIVRTAKQIINEIEWAITTPKT